MGGEKFAKAGIATSFRGSPPHGRGKAPFFSVVGVGFGITPAWAGKRKEYKLAVKIAGDHPRMGGEKKL